MPGKSDYQIFLAHANEDKPQVRELYRQLQEAGYRPWLDEEDLLPGQSWRDEIPKAIKKSDLFVACLSKQSIAKRSYVQREFRLALNLLAERPPGEIYLIPLKLDDCEIPDLRREEYGVALRDLQWLDYWKPGGFEKLMRAIEYQQGQPDSERGMQPVPPPTPQQQEKGQVEEPAPRSSDIRQHVSGDRTTTIGQVTGGNVFGNVSGDVYIGMSPETGMQGAAPRSEPESGERASQEKQLDRALRALQILQEQKAGYGLRVPVDLEIELEEKQAEVDRLKAELTRLRPASSDRPPAPPAPVVANQRQLTTSERLLLESNREQLAGLQKQFEAVAARLKFASGSELERLKQERDYILSQMQEIEQNLGEFGDRVR